MHPSVEAVDVVVAEVQENECLSNHAINYAYVSWDMKNSSMYSYNVKRHHYVNMTTQQKRHWANLMNVQSSFQHTKW
jgi:hypothetical protein